MSNMMNYNTGPAAQWAIKLFDKYDFPIFLKFACLFDVFSKQGKCLRYLKEILIDGVFNNMITTQTSLRDKEKLRTRDKLNKFI